MKRTPPFPGFSRGVPIIGAAANAEQPGLHYYLVSYFVQRPGEMPQAESQEMQSSAALNGASLMRMIRELEEGIAAAEPERPKARVVLIGQPMKLGFIPQHVLEAQEAELKRAAITPA